MLVLSRKLYETLVIADNITITVLEIKDDQVRIVIDAPNSVSVCIEKNHQKAKRKIEYKRFIYKFYKGLLKIYRIFTDLHIPIFLAKSK